MSDSRNLENNIVRLIAVSAFLIFAYFAIQLLAGIYSHRLTTKLSGPIEEMKNQYAEQIAAETGAGEAAKLGANFLKAQNDDLALLAFQRATDIDPSYRDAWVWRGYTELKNNQPEEALNSLKKAEDIDPVNARTYELLAIAYRQTGDADAAKKAQEKYQYLTKQR